MKLKRAWRKFRIWLFGHEHDWTLLISSHHDQFRKHDVYRIFKKCACGEEVSIAWIEVPDAAIFMDAWPKYLGTTINKEKGADEI
jgi:hypothetical protein